MLRTLKSLLNGRVFIRIEIETPSKNIIDFFELHRNSTICFLDIFSVHVGSENFRGFFIIFLVNQGEVRSIFFQPITLKKMYLAYGNIGTQKILAKLKRWSRFSPSYWTLNKPLPARGGREHPCYPKKLT